MYKCNFQFFPELLLISLFSVRLKSICSASARIAIGITVQCLPEVLLNFTLPSASQENLSLGWYRSVCASLQYEKISKAHWSLVDNKGSDQSANLRNLVKAFAGQTCSETGILQGEHFLETVFFLQAIVFGLLLKERICSQREQILYFKSSPY